MATRRTDLMVDMLTRLIFGSVIKEIRSVRLLLNQLGDIVMGIAELKESIASLALAVETEAAQIKSALELAASGAATPAQIQEAIESINRVTESVKGLAPDEADEDEDEDEDEVE